MATWHQRPRWNYSMKDLLVERFLHFFANTDPNEEVLRPGSTGLCCVNLRAALRMVSIPVEGGDSDLYDDELKAAVARFQKQYGHSIDDGLVGPGTRRRLVGALLARYGPSVFFRLQDPDQGLPAKVFVSYSTTDTPSVNKLDQWLRDHGVRIIRYVDSFQPGQDILDRARNAIATADKILVVHSKNSANSDWVRSEIAAAEELERRLERPLIVYLLLDVQPLPEHDHHRIAITAMGKPLRMIGDELLHAIEGRERSRSNFSYDENEPLA